MAKILSRIQIAIFLLACVLASDVAAQSCQITTSIHPIALLIRELVPQSCSVDTLLPKGGELHEFVVKPSKLRQLESSKLLIVNGRGIEPALFTSRGDSLRLGELNIQTSADPHLWLSPLWVREALAPLSAKLCEKLPTSCDAILNNSKRFERDLDTFLSLARQNTGPIKEKRFVAVHDAWREFAKAVGLSQVELPKNALEGQLRTKSFLTSLANAREQGVDLAIVGPHLPQDVVVKISEGFGFRCVELDEAAYSYDTILAFYQGVLDKLVSGLEVRPAVIEH